MHAWKGSHIIVTPVGNSHDRLDLDPGIIWKKEHPEISGTAKFGGKLLQIEENIAFWNMQVLYIFAPRTRTPTTSLSRA